MNEELRSQIDAYINSLFAREDEALQWIQQNAAANDLPAISVRPFEGRLLQFLLHAIGAKKVVEIGTLAGYSGAWIARALPADGALYTLERSSKHAAIARQSFARAGVAERVHLLEGDALVNLAKLTPHGPFDFVFIDADKTSTPRYLDWAERNLRAGGIVAVHNALRQGRIVAPETDDDRAMVAVNQTLAAHPAFETTLIGVGDGLLAAIKRPAG